MTAVKLWRRATLSGAATILLLLFGCGGGGSETPINPVVNAAANQTVGLAADSMSVDLPTDGPLKTAQAFAPTAATCLPAVAIAAGLPVGCCPNTDGLTPLCTSTANSLGIHVLGKKVVPAGPQTEAEREKFLHTLLGPDAAPKNFIRDDVERAIAAVYGPLESQVAYNVAKRYAFYLQTRTYSWKVGTRLDPAVQGTFRNFNSCALHLGVLDEKMSLSDQRQVAAAIANVRAWMGDTKSNQAYPEGRADYFAALDAEINDKRYSENRVFDLDEMARDCSRPLTDHNLPVPIAQAGRTNVLYIPGIRTDFSAAVSGALALRSALKTATIGGKSRFGSPTSSVRMFVLHNPMDWLGAGDALELRSSKINEEGYIDQYRKNFRQDVLNPPYHVDPAKQLYATYFENESERLKTAVRSINGYFTSGLKDGGKLVVVAHSQGNFIANWYHKYAMFNLDQDHFNNLRIVNVANVTRVSPNGLDVTSPDDNVIYELLATEGGSVHYGGRFSNQEAHGSAPDCWRCSNVGLLRRSNFRTLL